MSKKSVQPAHPDRSTDYATAMQCLNVFRQVTGSPDFPRGRLRPKWAGGHYGRFLLAPVNMGDDSEIAWQGVPERIEGKDSAVVLEGTPDMLEVADYESSLQLMISREMPQVEKLKPVAEPRRRHTKPDEILNELAHNYKFIRRLRQMERDLDSVLFFDKDNGKACRLYCDLLQWDEKLAKWREDGRALIKPLLARLITHADWQDWEPAAQPSFLKLTEETSYRAQHMTDEELLAITVARKKAGKKPFFMRDMRRYEGRLDLSMVVIFQDSGDEVLQTYAMDYLEKTTDHFFKNYMSENVEWPGKAWVVIRERMDKPDLPEDIRTRLHSLDARIAREKSAFVRQKISEARKAALRPFQS